MNIAFYSHYFMPEIGAPSARIYDLAQQWLAMHHSVQVITCFPNHPTGQLYPGYKMQPYLNENIDGIEVHRHWTYMTPNSGIAKRTLGHISYLPSSILFSHRQMYKPDIAVGTSPTFFAAIAAFAASKLHKIPFVMEVRDLWPALFAELGILKNRQVLFLLERLELSLYQQATSIVTVTESFRKNLVSRGVPEEKVFNIPNGADTDYWIPTPESNDLRKALDLEGKFIVLYIGAHGLSQGLSAVIEVANYLQKIPEIHFLLVGEGAEKTKLTQSARELGLTNIHFHESVGRERVKEFYALADVCLVPLRKIPLFKSFIPSKMFEIMAMARPIIGMVEGEAAEILTRSGGALIVEPENVEEAVRAIQYLHDHSDERFTMGQRGRSFVVDNYARSILASKYLDVMSYAQERYYELNTK